MQKINEQGDSVWLRTFSLIKDTSAYWVDHTIHDIVPAPDGGYIMSGDIAYPPLSESDTSTTTQLGSSRSISTAASYPAVRMVIQ